MTSWVEEFLDKLFSAELSTEALPIEEPDSTNRALMRLIKGAEGFVATPTLEPSGHLNIGFGYQIQPGEKFDKAISQAEGERLSEGRISQAREGVKKLFNVPLTNYEADALTDLIYRTGTTAVKDYKLRKKLNKGDREGAASEFLDVIYHRDPTRLGSKMMSEGLKRRALADAAIFLGHDLNKAVTLGRERKKIVYSSDDLREARRLVDAHRGVQ